MYTSKYMVDEYVLFTDCCASGTDSDWHWFWVDPLGLCDFAMLLMSICMYIY